jgi:outer membrane cobalamin receptor
MKSNIVILIAAFLMGYSQINAQYISNLNIKIELKGLALQHAIDSLQSHTGISIVYDSKQLKINEIIEQPTFNMSLKEVIYAIFGNEFELIEATKKIILKPKPEINKNSVLYGYINDKNTGETLPGATVFLTENTTIGTVSNVHGYYSITVPTGNHEIQVSYLGYESNVTLLEVKDQQRHDFGLVPSTSTLSEVVVVADRIEDSDVKIGTENINVRSVKSMPSLGGEPDPIKMIQMTPGVKSGGEGSSGLFVRGGNQDQNLILIDDAPVYNPTHLLGFFSVFHPDALKSVQFYKSNIPIEYGDRLSSLLDIRMKDGNNERFGVEGGIGLLSSRVMVEGPISKGASSYMMAFRRSYPDIFLRLSSSGAGNKMNFTDANMKLKLKLSEKDNLLVSGYFGQDNLRFFDQYENTWGNYTTSLRWQHLYGKNLFGNLVAYHSNYEYDIETFSNNQETVNWVSSISESTLKYDLNLYSGVNHLLKFGAGATRRTYNPGEDQAGFLDKVRPNNVNEFIVYIGHDWKMSEKIELDYGVRYNLFQRLSSEDEYILNEDRAVVDTLFLSGNQITKELNSIIPRLNLRYQLNTKNRFEVSYNRNVQLQHEIRNSSSPFNAFYVWLPSGINLPQGISDQFSFGYTHSFSSPYKLTSEVYYKSLKNQIDYRDHASIIQNNLIEQELRIGKGRAYGIEAKFEKTQGKLSGWIQYTYSRSLRQIKGINNNNEYPVFFDQPHSVSLLANYVFNQRSQFTLNWQYATGQPTNVPVGIFSSDETLIPIYEGRNNNRLPDFHRLDLSYSLKRKSGDYNNQSSWVFSLINVYYRKNALSLDYLPHRDPITGNVVDPLDKRIYKTYIFGIIPSISWNFKF